MSKRRLSTARGNTEKRARGEESCIIEDEVEESVVRSSEKSVADLTIKELKEELIATGTEPGPILPSTRSLYERLLTKNRAERKKEARKDRKPSTKPPTPTETPVEEFFSPTKSPARVKFDIECLPEPPVELPADYMSNGGLRNKLKELGEKPGPINDKNRKLYLDLLQKKQGGSTGATPHAAHAAPAPHPAPSTCGGKARLSFLQTTPASPMFNSTRIADECKEDSMDIDNTRVTKCRVSVCKAKFENMDYVVISPTNEFVNSTEYYLTLKEQGVHALVVQDYDNVSLVNVVKRCEGDIMIYAGVTIRSVASAQDCVNIAAQSGCSAIVLSLDNPQCSDPSSVVNCIKQVMQGKLSVSFFYQHSPRTTASPVHISQLLLQHVQGYQGILLSTSPLDLLQLELQGVKVYETNPDNILRSLAHGVDASATLLGSVIMPLIVELKGAFYEGNTSDCCKWQLKISRLNLLLSKHGDYLPSLHSIYKYLRRAPGPLPSPHTPLVNETLLFKDVADAAIFT